MIRFGADSAAVLQHDSLHDRQTQPRSGSARRKIRLKEPLEVPGPDPVSGVYDFRSQQTPRGVIGSGDCDSYARLPC